MKFGHFGRKQGAKPVRLASVGSSQYFWIGFQPSLRPSSVALCPKFQDYFRERRPPLLPVWGNTDPFFLPAGAKAFTHENPNAEVHFYDTGDFALETHVREIATAISEFLGRKLVNRN
jgi:hypothetical protein